MKYIAVGVEDQDGTSVTDKFTFYLFHDSDNDDARDTPGASVSYTSTDIPSVDTTYTVQIESVYNDRSCSSWSFDIDVIGSCTHNELSIATDGGLPVSTTYNIDL